MHRQSFDRLCESAVILLLAFVVLWKGGKTLESTWLLIGVAGVCTMVQYVRRQAEVKGQYVVLVVLLFILWTGLSSITSTTQNYGLDEVLRDGGLGLLLLWHLGRERTTQGENPPLPSFEERLLIWLAHLTILSCSIGIGIYLFQPVNRFIATFADPRFHTDYWPNAAAEFLLLAWPIVFLRATAYRTLYKPLPLGLVLGCLFLTYSRGALIALTGQIGLLLVLLLARQGVERRLWKPLGSIVVSLAIGFLVFQGTNGIRARFHPVESLQQKLTFTAAEGNSSISERGSFWKQAVTLTGEKPLFGWGPYSFRFVQPRLQTGVLSTSDHPHNVLLKLAMERGIGAALVFSGLAAMALLAGLRLTLSGKRAWGSDGERMGFALLTVAVAGVLAHNLIDYNLQFVGIALPFWLLMAMLLDAHHRTQPPKAPPMPRFSRFPLNGPRALLASLLVLIACREGFALVTSSFGRHAEARGDDLAALRWYERSEGEWFSRDMLLSGASLLLRENRLDDAEETLRAYLARNAEDARAWKLLGAILLAEESRTDAVEAYEQAFAYGGWNDLGISRGLLEALLAETYTQPTSAAAAESARLPLHPKIAKVIPAIELRVRAFAEAIERNLHFVSLSRNPEEAGKLFILLSVITPARAPEYQALAATIERKAQADREEIRGRRPGWLW